MKLLDLDPRWLACGDNGRFGMGLSFISPVSIARVAVWFKNPVDGGEPIEDGDKGLWERMGDTFQTLTLSPFVYASPNWRGRVKDGNVTSV